MLKFFSLDRTYTKWLQATVDKVHDHVLAGVWERSSVKSRLSPASIASRDFIALQQPRRCSNNLRVTAAFESLGFVIVGCGIGSTFHALYRVARKCFSRAERVLSTL
ncbi:hypothetical protein PI125_g13542 [Phytophthora idaei]|nr:hypothetical protein PI125_g13542 [Phytophthora idaei]